MFKTGDDLNLRLEGGRLLVFRVGDMAEPRACRKRQWRTTGIPGWCHCTGRDELGHSRLLLGRAGTDGDDDGMGLRIGDG
jgi:hypothetical protein